MSFSLLRSSLLTLALIATDVACAQSTTVATDPVGFITLSIAGAGSGGSSLSFAALGLARPVEFQGVASAAATANTITCASAGWTPGTYSTAANPYLLEIIGPPGEPGIGTTYDVSMTTANTATVITTAQNFAAGVAGTLPTFRLRKHWTLASVFGTTNQNGLASGFASSADTIQVLKPDGSYAIYYYSVSAPGWRTPLDDTTDRANTVLYPDDGLLITRKTSGVANVVLMGAVKTGQTSFPVLSGLSILANPYAAPMTLASSGLYTGNSSTGLTAGFESSADQVFIYNGSGYAVYYYNAGANGWRQVGDTTNTDMASVPLPVGSSFLVRRTGASFNWVAPQHPAAL